MIPIYKYLKELKSEIDIKTYRNSDPIIWKLSNTILSCVSPRKKS